MLKILDKYKGGILLILVIAIMFSMYTDRIKQLRLIEEQTNIAYYEK